MPRTIIKIKTWSCPHCGYRQDFDPENAELVKLHFPKLVMIEEVKGVDAETGTFNEKGEPIMKESVTYVKKIGVGLCPACFLGENPEKVRQVMKLVKEIDPTKKIKMEVMGEEEVETLELATGELDTKGGRVMRRLTIEEKQTKKKEIQDAIKRVKLLEDK